MKNTPVHHLSTLAAAGMPDDSTYINKKVLIAGGSEIYHGAPVLSSLSARICGPNIIVTIAIPRINETVTRILSADSIVIPLPDEKLTNKSVRSHLINGTAV